MVLTKDDLIESVRTRLGEDTSDEAISFLENVTDTINDYEDKAKGDGKDWKAEAERIDKEWREKYISRFNAPVDDKDDIEHKDVEEKKIKSYEDLFKTED